MTETRFPSFDDDDDEDQAPDPGETKSKPFVELRKHARELEKFKKDATPELEALRAYKQERDEQERTNALADVFKAVGLKESQIKLYPSDAEPNEAAIKAWATEYELVSPEADAGGASQRSSGGFEPATTGGPPGGTSGKVSRADWVAMQKEGRFDEAQRLYKEGRVDMSDLGGKYASS